MDELRAKLLRATSLHIVNSVESALSLPETVEVDRLIVPGADYQPETPKVAELGKERLLDAVRDFIKSDISMWQSLRLLDSADARITNCMNHLRRVAVLLAIVSGIAAVAAATDIYALHEWDLTWLHAVAFVASAFLLAVAACGALGIMGSVNRLETLKERHADLS